MKSKKPYAPKEIIYKGKLQFDSASHISLEKVLNFRWKEQNTICLHVDLLLEGLLEEEQSQDRDKISEPDQGPTGGGNDSLLKLINSDEFRKLTQQTEHSGWKSLINQIRANLNLS